MVLNIPIKAFTHGSRAGLSTVPMGIFQHTSVDPRTLSHRPHKSRIDHSQGSSIMDLAEIVLITPTSLSHRSCLGHNSRSKDLVLSMSVFDQPEKANCMNSVDHDYPTSKCSRAAHCP